jgi:hypothetical protein
MLRAPRRSTFGVLALAAWMAWLAFGGDEHPLAAPAGEEATEHSTFERPDNRYHDLGAVDALCDAWCRAEPGRVQRLVLPASASGLVPPAIVFGADGPGAAPLEARSTVLLLGGLDGRSLAGSEAVLRATHTLLAGLDTLRPDLAFVVVPWASPDGLARAAAGEAHDGRDGTPVDDDEDGEQSEDPPDDLDGDGELRELLIEDTHGPWTFSADRRFLVPASDGDQLRIVRVPEGRDDDGDGRWNEDSAGGIQLDAHFPAGWQGPGQDGHAGRFPLDDTLARALADLVRTRRTTLVLVFQGNHGALARPGGTLAAELSSGHEHTAYEALGGAFVRATGRALVEVPSLRAARGRESPGAAIDWLHGAGALAAEVAVWGPDAVGRDGRAVERKLPAPTRTRSGPAPTEEQRRWARWLDDVRGGLEFSEWRPIELGIGRRAWVGGWRRRADLDPPVDSLSAALAGVPQFVREVVDGLPRLDIEVARIERIGDLVRLRARVVNRGVFPTGRGPGAAESDTRDGSVVFTLEAPCDGALLAGDVTREVGVLGGGAAGPDQEWLVAAPPGTVLTLHARAGACGKVRREVRP